MSIQVETNIEVSLSNRNRQTVFFRWILVAPVVVFVALFAQKNIFGATIWFYNPLYIKGIKQKLNRPMETVRE